MRDSQTILVILQIFGKHVTYTIHLIFRPRKKKVRHKIKFILQLSERFLPLEGMQTSPEVLD